ncbi:MAG: hypothetical protein AB1705_13880 [Verrucomicrobiota bacterium]
MKTAPLTKVARLALAVGVLSLGAYGVAAADRVGPGRAMDLIKSYEKSGSAPGDKIDRTQKTMPGRACNLHCDQVTSGSAPGDKADRSSIRRARWQ